MIRGAPEDVRRRPHPQPRQLRTWYGRVRPVIRSRTSSWPDTNCHRRLARASRRPPSPIAGCRSGLSPAWIWSARPPTAAGGNGAERIRTEGGGYLLTINPERVDAHQFRAMVERSRTADGPDDARAVLRAALDLWRGPVLGGWCPTPPGIAMCQGLEAARRAVHPDGRAGAVVVAIAGPAGVGKTALAVHVAHALQDQFADGQLFANLRGVEDDEPAEPAEVLGRFLRALGVDGAAVGESLEDRTDLYRRLLAGRRVLVILDNAGSAEQVLPLVPGSPGCAVIVTSRRAARPGDRRGSGRSARARGITSSAPRRCSVASATYTARRSPPRTRA